MIDYTFPSRTPKTETSLGIINRDVAVAGPAYPSQLLTDEIEIQHLTPSYEYGQGSQGTFEQLGTDDKAFVGDVLRITYHLDIPFMQDWQAEYLVSRLNEDSRVELRHVALNEEIRRLIVEVKVLKPFSPAILIPIAIIAVLAGGLIWLSTRLVERLTTLFQGDPKNPAVPWLSITAVGGLVLAAVAFLPKLRAP